MKRLLLFSLFEPDDPLAEVIRDLTPAMREGLIILGALFAVVVAAVLWAVLLRKRRRGPHHHHHRRRRHRSFSRTAAAMTEIKQLIHEKEHRRRREHRPRNPTLAETGGLPPARPDEPPVPPQTQSPTP